MTKKQLEAALAQFVAAQSGHAPAATVAAVSAEALPAWVQDARAIATAQAAPPAPKPPKQPAYLTRTWGRQADGMSKSGNPYATFRPTSGQAFDVRLPLDLYHAIKSGKL